ncbi:hypothetical protein EDB62_102239 [Vibrio crassostreae]|nr:hypothetical protein EDB62_102239 [Vibrio crassostreae]TWD72819.1 hypothetical protein FB445_102242 [Vibrio crassostreae]
MCSFLDDLHTGSDLPTSPGSLKGKGAFSFLFFISLFPIFLISIFLFSCLLRFPLASNFRFLILQFQFNPFYSLQMLSLAR